MLALAGGLFACAAPPPPARSSREELLQRFDTGRVQLDCGRCRYDFRDAEWLLEQGEYEALVLGILSSGDGSGRSWYLLGRVAEATDRRELALHYYHESLATRRNPILALLPLYEDLSYRLRRLAAKAAPEAAGPPVASAPRAPELEQVSVDALVVATRPGVLGAFVEKLHRGDGVDVLDRSGDWEQVRLADGRMGWVWGAYTSDPDAEPAAKPAAPRRTAKRVAKQAKAAKAKAAKAPAPAPKAKVAKAPAPEPAPQAVVAKTPAPEVPEPAPKAVTPKTPVAEPAAQTLAEAAPEPARKATSKALAALVRALPSAEKPAAASALAASSDAGILGCPLPRGASLSGRSHGAEGAEDHPTETYAVDAPAQEIVGFYEREMERAGWRKSFAASEFLLYFEKDDRSVGVLIERKGGLFTLMGS